MPVALHGLSLYRTFKHLEEVSVMLSGALTLPIETAFMAIVLPVVCAYLVLVAMAATRLVRDTAEHETGSQSMSDQNTR